MREQKEAADKLKPKNPSPPKPRAAMIKTSVVSSKSGRHLMANLPDRVTEGDPSPNPTAGSEGGSGGHGGMTAAPAHAPGSTATAAASAARRETPLPGAARTGEGGGAGIRRAPGLTRTASGGLAVHKDPCCEFLK